LPPVGNAPNGGQGPGQRVKRSRPARGGPSPAAARPWSFLSRRRPWPLKIQDRN